MPLYEYVCKKHGKFEKLVFHNEKVTCPECDGEVKKILSPSGFNIKGYSYKNGYSDNEYSTGKK